MVAPLPYEALPATPQVLLWQLAQLQACYRRPQHFHLMPSLLISPPLPRAPRFLHNPPPIPLSCQVSARHRRGPRHPSPPSLAVRICRLQGAYGLWLIALGPTCFASPLPSILALVLLPGPLSPSLRPTTMGLPTSLGPSLALLVHSNRSFLSNALTVSPPQTDGSKFDPSGDIKL